MSESSVPAMDGGEVLLDVFASHLRAERGLAPGTIECYVGDVRRFLADQEGIQLNELTPSDITRALMRQLAVLSSSSVQRYGCALRSFLRYCHQVGLIDRDLSAAALPVSRRKRSLLPMGITPAQASALLATCDRSTAAGRRAYAVILVILRLGLRATEVATLRLEDMDWRAGQLTVHGKGRRVDPLPMPVDVGEAITSYLRRDRPRQTTAREVFLRVQPPHVGMTRGGVTAIVLRASRQAGIGSVRAHRLRHTAAGDMLRAGVPLAEIGQVLRQRSAGSTAIYARVDVERLRTIARPWPTGAAS